jgi:putative oxidoreductase
MRDSALLGLRLTLGGYLATHGAQKLFGSFGGPGLVKAGAGFEHLGLRPGKAFAALAGGSELAGGILTAVGAASPVGPLAIAGAMVVASATHSDKGPMLQKGGFELPATNLVAAVALMATGPGRYSLDELTGLRLSKVVRGAAVLGAAVLTGFSAVQVLKTKRLTARAQKALLETETEPSATPADTSEPTSTAEVPEPAGAENVAASG